MRRYGLVDIPDEPSDIGAIPVSSDSIISGGIVTWSGTGLVFNVSACNYYIDGQNYNSPDATLTLATADPTNDRIDVFAVDINGDAIIITGTPSPTPQEPQVDPATQIKLTTVIVGAGATVPSGVTNNMIYDENVEAWSKSSNSLTVDYVNTTTPYVGTYCILATTTAAATFKALTFYKASTYANKGDYDIFSFAIKLSQTLLNTESIKIIFSNTSLFPNIKVAEYAITSNNSLGLSFSNTSGYQLIGIPMGNINFTNNSFNYVQIQFVTSRTGISFRLDRILLQYGINQPTSPTATNSFGNVVSQSGTASATMPTDTLTINGSGLATTSVSGKTLTVGVTNPVSGTLNYISKFTGSGATIGNSLVYDNGTSVAIGTTSPVADTLLQVEGKVQSNVSTSSTSSSIYSVVGNTAVTYAGGSTLSGSVVVNAVQGGSAYTFGGNLTIPNSCVTSSLVAVSSINFTSTGTVTQNQAGYVRSIANIFAMWTKGTNVSGTVTHMSNLRLVAFYTPHTSTTLTVNNYYGIIIEDANQFTGVSISNKWGIYQEGSTDNNYFAGKVLIGTNTVGSQSLSVVGSAIISSTVTLSNLAGSGTRMVVADGSGVLSTQAIPSGGSLAIGDTITSATAGSVLFAGTSGVLAQDNANFFWDDTNNRLGIGTATPTADIDITRGVNGAVVHQVKNTTTGTSAQAVMNFIADSNKTAQMQKLSTSFATPVAPLIGGDFAITNYSSGHMVFVNNFSTGRIKFAAGGSTTAQMSLTAAGRLLLGTTTEGTDLLDVNGTAKFLNGITINRSGTAYIILQNAGSAYLQMRGNTTYTGLDITNGAGSVRYWSFSSDTNTSGWTNAKTVGRFNLLGSTSPSVVPALFAENSNLSVQNAVNEIIRLQSNITSAQMIDGFGGDIKMYIRDTDAVDNHIASISFRRIGGADNTGALYFSTANAGTVADRMVLTNNAVLSINNTSPNSSAQLQVDSTTRGFLPPRLTTTQRTAISSPPAGLEIYNSTLNVPSFYNGLTWVEVLSSKLYDGLNIETGYSTGTKIGTDATQKIGFFNATPVIQQDTTISASTFVASTGTNINSNSTFDGYKISQVVKALRNLGLLA